MRCPTMPMPMPTAFCPSASAGAVMPAGSVRAETRQRASRRGLRGPDVGRLPDQRRGDRSGDGDGLSAGCGTDGMGGDSRDTCAGPHEHQPGNRAPVGTVGRRTAYGTAGCGCAAGPGPIDRPRQCGRVRRDSARPTGRSGEGAHDGCGG